MMTVVPDAAKGLVCPFRREGDAGEVLCYDPLGGEWARPPEEVAETWCPRDYPHCPIFIACMDGLEFMLLRRCM